MFGPFPELKKTQSKGGVSYDALYDDLLVNLVLLNHNMHKRRDLRYFGVSVTQSGTRAYTRPTECIRFGGQGGWVGT